MLTTIQIADLRTYAYHALFEEERNVGDKVTSDVEVDVCVTLGDVMPAQIEPSDRSVHYRAVVDAVIDLATDKSYPTLDALGEAVAAGLLTFFAAVDMVHVRVSKPLHSFAPASGRSMICLCRTRAVPSEREACDDM